MAKSELILGSGVNTTKRMRWSDSDNIDFENPVTLDIQEPADVLWDLNDTTLPFADNRFDEIHAYEVLEHVGTQGDFKFFFDQFRDFYRILKPGGFMCISVPMWDSPWSFGDPGHTRVMPKEIFSFLDPVTYEQCKDKDSSAADYSEYLGDINFECIGAEESEHQLAIILKKV